MINLPQVFLDRMKSILNEEYDSFLSALENENQKAIIVNKNKISVEDFKKLADFPIEKIPYDPYGFYIENEKLGRHPLHHAGAFYIQEPSAMFTVNAHKFNGDEMVLDLCAAPGGKTIQLANRVPNGFVLSNEIDKARSEILFSNVERMGLKNVAVCNDKTENIASSYANSFDVVLVDAPCSGEGMFRKGEKMIEHWNENLNTMCANRQLKILEDANVCLKQNGILIYSTCTYSLEENEGVVKEFLNRHNYELVKFEHSFNTGIGLEETARLYPHKVKGEGQFVAVLKKKEENTLFPAGMVKFENSRLAHQFFKEVLVDQNNLVEYKNYVYFVPNLNMIKKGVNFVACGVRVGSTDKGRFEPFHQLFSAFGKEFKNQINLNLNSVEVKKYLKGETFEVDSPDGYGVVKIENCPVGGFKQSKGMFKNLYPKGLRNFN